MPAHYFKCFNCDAMFVTGEEVPSNLVCVIGRCDIKEISKEKADEVIEDMRNE